MSRILGIDMGDKRIGLALSDATGIVARGLEVIHLKSIKTDIFEYLKKIAIDYDVSKIILGLPRNMDGSIGEQAKKVIEFGDRLRNFLPDRTVEYYDERLSTSEALRTLIEADISRAKRKNVVDKVSAVIILQNYLDSINRRSDYARNGNSESI